MSRVSVFYKSRKYKPYIMEVESDGNGVFTIPTTGGGYNYDVKTSDGQTFSGVAGNHTITFPSANTRYDVEISGLFPRFYFNNGSERLKIKDIKQWGDVAWGAVQDNAFYGCEDMTCSALDLPDMEHITSAFNMFRTARKFNPTTFDLKFANLVNGERMFSGNWLFNPIDFAPTFASLTNGTFMFYGMTSFVGSVFNPTLASLTNGNSMFNGATSFNPPLFNPTLANLTNGSYMFRDATSFNPPLFNPTLASLTNGSYMFEGTASFVGTNFAPTFGSLTSVGNMFRNSALDVDTSTWDFSTIIDIAGSGATTGMFYNSRFSVIDMSDQLTGSINLQNMKQLCAANSNLTTLRMQAGSVTSNPIGQGNPSGSFGATPNLKTILMYDLNIDMSFTAGLTASSIWCSAFFESKVDILNFCNSIRDMTGDVTRAVTLQDRGVFSPSDINDIETAFNLKNWTVIWV